jgi:hypothetical protein
MKNKNKKTELRKRKIGSSNYTAKKIQPYDIWIEYMLNPFDADVVKRVLRTKKVKGMSPKKVRIEDYKKIIHICETRIEQIKNGDPYVK